MHDLALLSDTKRGRAVADGLFLIRPGPPPAARAAADALFHN
ncbi:hypothetical protein ACFXJO_03495 [Streptomyces lavendulae]